MTENNKYHNGYDHHQYALHIDIPEQENETVENSMLNIDRGNSDLKKRLHRQRERKAEPARIGAPPRPFMKGAEKRTKQYGLEKPVDGLAIADSYQQQRQSTISSTPSIFPAMAPVSLESPMFGNSAKSADSRLSGPINGTSRNNDITYFDSSYGSTMYDSLDIDGLYSQQDQIRNFSRMALESSLSPLDPNPTTSSFQFFSAPPPLSEGPKLDNGNRTTIPEGDSETREENILDSNTAMQNEIDRKRASFLMSDVKYDDDGNAFFDENVFTMSTLIRQFFYNPLSPELTALQQFIWAVLIGIACGLVTAWWHMLIEAGIDVFWSKIPIQLYRWGVFTDDDGKFPIYHYVWMLPSLMSAILSYIFAALPNAIPSQDEWITNVHSQGVQDHRTFYQLLFLSTGAMWSGLCLGPELPLVLTGVRQYRKSCQRNRLKGVSNTCITLLGHVWIMVGHHNKAKYVTSSSFELNWCSSCYFRILWFSYGWCVICFGAVSLSESNILHCNI
jgi:hypothetical protein